MLDWYGELGYFQHSIYSGNMRSNASELNTYLDKGEKMEELGELLKNRRAKIEKLREMGVNPFANDFRVTNITSEIVEKYKDVEGEELSDEKFTIAGRIMAVRSFGKAAFVILQDRAGKLQVFIQKNLVGDEQYELFKLMDIGDIIGVTGTPVRTRTGELTLKVENLRHICKSLLPLPEKWHGLTDVEARYRQRWVDLTVNPEAKEVFIKRNYIISYIRNYLRQKDFVEVETPMMHPIPGGGAARPFVTHHNTLDMDLYLRVAPELYLKRLLVGGMERVFEINRNFRNEGVSTRHNPEFTMMEFYWAYANYHDLMDLTEDLFSKICMDLHGTTKIEYQGKIIDFTPPWQRLTVRDALAKYGDISREDIEDHAKLLAYAKKINLPNAENMVYGKLLMELVDEVVEHNFIQPTFMYEYPLAVSPLSRKNEQNPEWVDRFELIIGGMEVANAFNELNDPIDQRLRLEDQVRQKAMGDEEAQPMDDEFIKALEFGMPPAAGEGIGIDRLVMLMTNQASIREVILFPLLRKEV